MGTLLLLMHVGPFTGSYHIGNWVVMVGVMTAAWAVFYSFQMEHATETAQRYYWHRERESSG